MEYNDLISKELNLSGFDKLEPEVISAQPEIKNNNLNQTESKILKIAEEKIANKQPPLLTSSAWKDKKHLKLDRDSLQKRLIQSSHSHEVTSLSPMFNFFQNLFCKVKRILGFVKETSPQPINFTILSQVVRAVPPQGNCPSSVLLSYLHKHIHRISQDSGEITPERKELEERLALAAKWSSKIEKFQQTKDLHPNSKKLKKFIEKLQAEVSQLKIGDKRLIPGGWQQEEGGFSEALYEVEKTGPETFTIRVLSLNEENKDYWKGEKDLENDKIRYNPVLEFREVSTQLLKESLEPLIHLQMPQIFQSAKNKKRGFLEERIHTLQRLLVKQDSGSAEIQLTPLGIMQAFYEKSPQSSEQNLLVKVSSDSNFSKILLTYLKSVDLKSYKASKLEFELSIFFACINEDGQALLQNPELRDLMQVSARKLIYELGKNRKQIGLSDDNYQDILRDLKDFLIVMQKLDQKAEKIELPPIKTSPLEQHFKMSHSPINIDKLHPSLQVNKKSAEDVSFKNLSISQMDQILPNMDSQKILETVQEQIQTIKTLYNKEDYVTMEALILDLVRQLPPPIAGAKQDFWETVYNKVDQTQKEIVLKKWQDAIFALSQLLFDCQQLQTTSSISPEKIIANANLLAIADRLMVLKGRTDSQSFILKIPNENGFYPTVYFDPKEIKQLLRNDRYFRSTSASQHRLAEDLLKYWDDTEANANKNFPRARISLDNWNHFRSYFFLRAKHGGHAKIPVQTNPDLQAYITEQAAQDYRYITKCLLAKTPDAMMYIDNMEKVFKEIEVNSDGSNFFPPEFIQQRKMHLMAKGFLTQQHAFVINDLTEFMEAGNRLVKEAGSSINTLSQQEMWQRLWKLQSEKVQAKFQEKQPKINSKTKEREHILWSMDKESGDFLLHPAGVRFSMPAYKEWKMWHSDQDFYKGSGKYLDEYTDEEIVQFELGIKNEGEKILTQQTLMNRSLSKEEAILKGMQAGASRLEQTFATFSQYPELLNSPSRQRLFELNLFKQGELLKKINDQPNFARELLAFAKNNLELARGTRNIQRALFFMQLQDNLKEYVRLSDLPTNEKENILQAFPSLKGDYQHLLEICINDSEKRLVYGAGLSHYLHQIEAGNLSLDQLSQEEKINVLKEITKGYFLYKSLNANVADQNPEIDKQIQYLMIRVKPHLKEILREVSTAQVILDNLFEILKLPISQTPLLGEFPYLSQGSYKIDFDKGLIFEKNKANGLLPKEVIENEMLNRIFKNKKTGELLKGEVQLEFKTDLKTGEELIIYTFKQQPNLRLIQQKGRDLIIQMKMQGQPKGGWFKQEQWFELLPFQDPSKTGETEDLEQQLPAEMADLVLNRFVWREVNHPSRFIVKDENNENYLYDVKLQEIDNSGWQLKEVKRFKDGLILVNPWKIHKQLGALTAIEDVSHIKAWGNASQKVQEFEFPRFKTSAGNSLTYCTKKIKQDGKKMTILESVQYKGLIMPFQPASLTSKAPKENLGIEILPHMFKDFQLLINPHTGTKKVLIPLQQATWPGMDSEESQKNSKYSSWSDQVKLDHHPSSFDHQVLLEFEVDPVKNVLKTDNKQANLFLAYLFFTSNRYEQALEFLNASETSLAMSNSHRNIYQWIDGWADKNPEGIAFKLKAALALKANQFKQELNSSTPEQQFKEAEHLAELFKAYKKVQSEIPLSLQLSNKEEKVYQSTINQTYVSAFTEKPLEEKTVPIRATDWKQPRIKSENLLEAKQLAQKLFVEIKGNKLPEDEFLLASDKPFIQGFRTLYETIYQEDIQSDQYRKIKQLVQLAQPPSPIARETQRILKAFIDLKEGMLANNQNSESIKEVLKPFAFPVKFKQPYFLFSRLASITDGTAPLKELEDLLDIWIKMIQKEDEKIPLAPKKDKLEDLPKKRKQFNPEEGIELLGIIDINENNFEFNDASPQDFFNDLKKSHKLEKISKDRRIAESTHRCKEVSTYLNQHPVEPSSIESRRKSIIGAPHQVLENSESVENFFEIKSMQRNPLEGRVKETVDFFNDYTDKKEIAPSVQRLAQKYKEDTQLFIEGQKVEEIKFKPGINLDELQRIVQEKFDSVSKNRQTKEAQILSLIKPQSLFVQKELSKQLETIPQRLIGFYIDGRMQDVNILMGLKLNEEQIKKLEEFVKEWMVATIQERVLIKGLDQLRDISDISDVSKEMLQELHQTLLPKRFFSIDAKKPEAHFKELLAIEFATGFILRANQVETINAMLEDPNQVKQLGMGQGKSSVILPMLLHRLADGKQLAIGILPEWLYEIVSQDLDKSSRALFGQDIFKFEFDRNTEMDREWLLNQYATLGEAIKNRHAVVTTKTFLLSFRNKFLEMQAESEHAIGNEQTILNEKLGLMANILTLFKERGAAIADEVDTILDVRQELNYALGFPEKTDEKKWQMGLQVYRKIREVSSEYADKLQKNEQGLFVQEDIEVIQQQLAKAFFNDWQSKINKNGLLISEENFCNYVQGKNELSVSLIDGMPIFMDELKKSNQVEIYQNISLLRQYLSQTLLTTLSHSGNVHYGRAIDGENTIPYKANNTPSEAEFGEEFERIGHFIQDYLQNGLSERQVQVWVTNLLTKISSEMYEHLTEHGSMGNFKEMPTYQHFHEKFSGIDLTQVNQDPAVLREFLKQLNKDATTKLGFLEDWIFPTLKMANQQVSSNAHNLVNMVSSFSGFTGTPWNTDTYHNKIQAQEAQVKGTDGKTIELLTSMFAAGELNINTIDLDTENPLDSILNSKADFLDRYDSLIDAGYYLKGIDNQDVVIGLSKIKSKKKAVVYVTNENEKVIQTLGLDDAQPLQNRKDIKMDERITYYDQAHTIGTDNPHTQNARAALTVGEKMYVKDFFQALWRMRKIDQGQKVDLIISKDVKELIKASRGPNHPNKKSDTITIQDVILFCIKNQAEREAEDNLRAERQKIMGLVPEAMFWQLVEASQIQLESKKELFKIYKEFLFKNNSSNYDAMAKVATPEETHKVLNDLRNHLVNVFENVEKDFNNEVFKKELSSAIDDLKNYPLLDANKLPEKTEALSNDAKDSQVQTQRQQQQQISVEIQAGIIPPNPDEKWNAWNAQDLAELWNIAQTMEQASQAIPFLDPEIRFTPNFAPTDAQSKELSLSDRLLSPKRIPVAQVLVLQNTETKELCTLLLDIKDYEEVILKLMKPSPNQKFKAAVFDIRPQNGSLLLRSTESLNSNPWNNDEMQIIKDNLVKIKVFNRQVNFYDKQEVKALKSWVDKEPQKIQNYFETYLLTGSLQSTYESSTLAKIFQNKNSELVFQNPD